MDSALGLLNESEKTLGADPKSVGKQLNDQFAHISQLVNDLVSSKRAQFLHQSTAYYTSTNTPTQSS